MDRENPNRKFLVEEYKSRINRVIDYIEANIDRDLSLKELSDIAHFSPFHFHRIFRAMVGETLNEFTQRIRLEKAAARLIANPRKSITEIALECGFSSPSAFARAFRETYKMSASRWRSGGYLQHSKNGKQESKESQSVGNFRQDFDIYPRYTQDNTGLIWRVEMKNGEIQTEVEVRDMPEIHVAYVRHIGPYKGDSELFGRLFNKLMAWAGPRGLLRFPETKIMTIYYDDPELTDDSKLRTDACITVPEGTEVDGEIGKTTIPAGKYAIAHFEINVEQYQDAWNTVYSGWLPESGYQPGDGPCYELYPGNPDEYSGDKHLVDIYVPVKPL
ncbi:GyrI-like domain-containing protein [Chloroflexota bacterium]